MHHKTFYVCPSVQSLSSFRYEMGHGFRSARTKQNDDNREIMLTKKVHRQTFQQQKQAIFETLRDAVWLDYLLCKKLRGNDTSVLGLNACTITAC